ncbi:hypothetical protein Ahu01nite_022980 [Winogradskya humida]|uniref:DUF4760 domain-containing protein n=2 Tax=Winogradskya humida TaxID=113566 RepID=A0ABQ3ZKT8_9ACTN|nr:hypothetical protein Ahu01nite_022980 [Actinoplanes humidus]
MTLGLVGAIVVSPWIIRPFLGQAEEWRELSDVGQAYGGISAILSGLAFCGIAVSLLLQWRQVRLTQLLATRERHFELVKLGLEDPSLIFPTSLGRTVVERRQVAYFNLWVSYWAMLWDASDMGALEARVHFDELFGEEVALNWWTRSGATWSTDPDRRRRTFMAIAHAAYRDAISARIDERDRTMSEAGDNRVDAKSDPASAAEGYAGDL